jgi:phospholipase/lecithinase/hemolysin
MPICSSTPIPADLCSQQGHADSQDCSDGLDAGLDRAAGSGRWRALVPRARRLLEAAAVGAVLTASLLPHAALAGVSSLSKLFVFGDSLSDSGNGGGLTGGLFTPSPPYAGNRASNGPVAVEQLWQLFNPGDTNFKPSSQGGTNYAILGATSGKENNLQYNTLVSSIFVNKGNALQLQSFLAAAPSFDPQTSLFVVWLFPNDVLYYRSSGRGDSAGTYNGFDGTATTLQAIDELAVSNVIGTVNALAGQGARHFLVVNSPDLGRIPAFLSGAEAADMTQASQDFNSLLETELATFTVANPLLDIELFQLDDAMNDLVNSPASHGISNVTNACLTSVIPATVCSDPSQYLYWDSFHPTTVGHGLIAQQMYNTVYQPAPTPGPLPLLGSLAALGWSRRLRRRQRQQGQSVAGGGLAMRQG